MHMLMFYFSSCISTFYNQKQASLVLATLFNFFSGDLYNYKTSEAYFLKTSFACFSEALDIIKSFSPVSNKWMPLAFLGQLPNFQFKSESPVDMEDLAFAIKEGYVTASISLDNVNLNLDKNVLFTFLSNGIFVLLFLSMFIYWIETAFFKPAKIIGESPETMLALQNPNKNMALNLNKVQRQLKPDFKNWLLYLISAKTFMQISNIFSIFLLVLRWEMAGHFPLSNLYESLIFLSWCCTFLHLLFSSNFSPYKNQEKILGSIIAPCALLMYSFATFTLPKEMQIATPLVPALQSNWLMMHVTVMIISYASLIIGSLLSIAYLIINKTSASLLTKDKDNSLSNDTHTTEPQLSNKINDLDFSSPFIIKGLNNKGDLKKEVQTDSLFLLGAGASLKYDASTASTGVNNVKITRDKQLLASIPTKLISNLDYLSYRIIGLGFPFLTIGILSGAVWANEAWGSYWSWDPKETWALLTWFVFAIYLHTRLNYNEKGEKPAIIAAIGFIVVWFCYLGVNLIGDGLHSYGFFNK